MSKNKKSQVISISLLCLFLIYPILFNSFFNLMGISNKQTLLFISDILFSLLIIYIYRKKLKLDLKSIKKMSSKAIGKILYSIIILLGILFIIALFTYFVFPNYEWNTNNTAIYNLYKENYPYFLFKIFLFSSITEELLFKENMSKLLPGNIAFIFISSLVYVLFNFIFSISENQYAMFNIIIMYIQAMSFSYIYIKNDRNIVISMIIKFLYNLLPFISLSAGVLI